MNRIDFLNLMESTEPIDPKKTADIGEIVAIFPYFHSAHLLLLKGLHNNSDVRFGNQLRNSAIYLANREILYNYLYTQNANAPNGLAEEMDHHDETLDEANHRDEPLDEKNHHDETVGETIHDEPVDETDHYDETVGETIHHDEPVGVEALHATPVEALHATPLLELDTTDNTAGNGIMDIPADEPNAGVQATDPDILSQSDLIDRFIISNPRIEPIRDKKEISLEDRSERLESDGCFVTETLARIYITQGYYSKAIDIFERLILKYPEKSSYFATQIEKVKEYLKK